MDDISIFFLSNMMVLRTVADGGEGGKNKVEACQLLGR